MSRRILIIDSSCDPSGLGPRELEAFTDLVTLCWLSPDSVRRIQEEGVHVRCHSLPEVVGGLERWEQEAIALTERICAAGPRYRDLPWRYLVEEQLYREALTVRAVLDAWKLCRRLTGSSTPEFDLRVSEDLERLFYSLSPGKVGRHGAAPSARQPRAAPTGLAGRLVRRARNVLLTGNLKALLWNLFDQLDRTYRLRCTLRRFRRRPRPAPGAITFFSSYLNDSLTLRTVEPYVPGPVHWIVTNLQARTGAAGHRGNVDWLWHFAAGIRPPEPADALASDPRTGKPGSGSEEPTDRLLAAWLAASPGGHRSWRRSLQVSLARLTAGWEHYLDEARPRLVVVANQCGIVGWLTRLARQRGIPVLQVLHGIRDGEFFTGRPLVSDALVVWGELWRELWPESERAHIEVIDGHVRFECVERRPSAGRPRLTYFSWPIEQHPYNVADLMGGFIDLFDSLLRSGDCELTLRAHPLEDVSKQVGYWRRRRGSLPPHLRFSQYEPLRNVLAETDIAVMFRSTVMLDCFASGIPVLMPGWIDFSWKHRLEGLRGVHLASDFRELREVLDAWIEEPPEPDSQQIRPFLQPAEEARRGFGELVEELIGV